MDLYGLLQVDRAWQDTLDFLHYPPRRPASLPTYRFAFPPLQVVQIETTEQLHEHARAINETATALGYIGFDLEHDRDANIRYVQLSTDHARAFVFNVTALTNQALLHNEHIRGLLESPGVLKVGVGISGKRVLNIRPKINLIDRYFLQAMP